MSRISTVFELLEEQEEYLSYIPSVTLGYLYILSDEFAFGLSAIAFGAIAAGLVELKSNAERWKETMDFLGEEKTNRQNFFVGTGVILVLGYLIGYFAAVIASWNVVVPSGWVVPSPPAELDGYIGFLFRQGETSSDLILATLLYILLIRSFVWGFSVYFQLVEKCDFWS